MVVPVGNDYIFWPLGLVSGDWINIHSAEVSIQFLTLFYALLLGFNSQFQAAWLVHVNLHNYKHMLHVHPRIHLIHASLNLYIVELCSSAYRTPILLYSMSIPCLMQMPLLKFHSYTHSFKCRIEGFRSSPGYLIHQVLSWLACLKTTIYILCRTKTA